MITTTADIVNQALDLLGADQTVGDIQEGTPAAAVALRHYGPTLRQVMQAANWQFCRKRAPLLLLQDATGTTTQQQIAAGGPVTVGTGTVGMKPWVYEYQFPIDGIRPRFVPMTLCNSPGGTPSGNIGLPSTQQTTGTNAIQNFARQVPAPFCMTSDNNPSLVGAITDWSQIPDYASISGQSLTGGTVILTNQINAELVYTAFISAPDQWDFSFRQAIVAVLSTFLAMPCLKDKKLARIVRDEQIKTAKQVLDEARRIDGDMMWASTDHTPDWMRVRSGGAFWGAWGGPGIGGDGVGWGGDLWCGWGSVGFGDGSAY